MLEWGKITYYYVLHLHPTVVDNLESYGNDNGSNRWGCEKMRENMCKPNLIGFWILPSGVHTCYTEQLQSGLSHNLNPLQFDNLPVHLQFPMMTTLNVYHQSHWLVVFGSSPNYFNCEVKVQCYIHLIIALKYISEYTLSISSCPITTFTQFWHSVPYKTGLVTTSKYLSKDIWSWPPCTLQGSFYYYVAVQCPIVYFCGLCLNSQNLLDDGHLVNFPPCLNTAAKCHQAHCIMASKLIQLQPSSGSSSSHNCCL